MNRRLPDILGLKNSTSISTRGRSQSIFEDFLEAHYRSPVHVIVIRDEWRKRSKLNKMAQQVHIRTPSTNPDRIGDVVEVFERNLAESIRLLQQYDQMLDRQKATEVELEESKEATISSLIKKLVERRRDQGFVRQCIGILRKLGSEYEEVKERIIADTLASTKVTVADQWTQCEAADLDAKLSVGTSTCREDLDENVLKKWKSELVGDGGSGEKDTSGAFGVENWKEGSVAKADVDVSKVLNSDGVCEVSSGSRDDFFSPKKKDESKAKAVRFSKDVPGLPACQDSLNTQKRVPLQATPINIYSHIIPAHGPENVLPEIPESTTSVSISKRNNSSLRGKLLSKVANPNPGKLSRSELQKIYNIETLRAVKRPNFGDKCSPSNATCSASASTSHKSLENCSSILELPKQQVRINPSHDPDETIDDFTPYDIHIPNCPSLGRTVLTENTSNFASNVFQKKLSSVTRQPKKSAAKKVSRKMGNENKRNREKPEELSSNGKRLVQTLLNFQPEPIDEIEEFSTSVSDVESIAHDGHPINVRGQESLTEGSPVKIEPLAS